MMFHYISVVDTSVCLCSHLHQRQEDEGVHRFWLGTLRSGGPLQERHADPQLQGDPENQRQKGRQIGLLYFTKCRSLGLKLEQ